MKRLVLCGLLSLNLLGCTSSEIVTLDVTGNNQIVSEFSNVEWLNVNPTKFLDFEINEKNQQLILTQSPSPIAAFSLDSKGKEMEVTITSHFGKSVFYPNVLLLSESNQIIKKFNEDDFEYKHAHGMKGDRLETNFSVQPSGEQKVKLLIFTTDKLVSEESTVLHPAKIDAIGRGNYPPDIPDPVVPHSKYGKLSLAVEVDETITVKDPVVVNSSDIAHEEAKKSQAAMIDQQEKERLASKTNIVVKQENSSVITDSQKRFYLESIESAVNAGYVDKALALLEEAKALGVEGAQEAFVKAVNSK